MNIHLTQQTFSTMLMGAIQETGSGFLFGTQTESAAECCGIVPFTGKNNQKAVRAANQLLPAFQLTGAYDIRSASSAPGEPGKTQAAWAESSGFSVLVVVQRATGSLEPNPFKLFYKSYPGCEFTYGINEEPLQESLPFQSRSICCEIGGFRFEMRGYYFSSGKWEDAPLYAAEANVLLALQSAFGEVVEYS